MAFFIIFVELVFVLGMFKFKFMQIANIKASFSKGFLANFNKHSIPVRSAGFWGNYPWLSGKFLGGTYGKNSMQIYLGKIVDAPSGLLK